MSTASSALRPAAGLAAVAASCVLSGCAGTAPAADDGSSAAPSSSSSAPPSTSATPGRAPEQQRIEVEVTGGRAAGNTGRVPVPVGTSVSLVVTSDAPDEVHVHGYDLEAAVEPGTPAELVFDATLPGVFEVELHDAGTVLLTLQVQ